MALVSQASSVRRWAIPALAVVVFLAVVAGLTLRMVQHLHGTVKDDQVRWGMIDFRDVVFYPARAVWDGVNPYDSENTTDPARYRGRYPVGNLFPLYSPVLVLLASPLQVLPYHAAMAVYVAANVGLIVLLAWAALTASGLKANLSITLVIATLILLSRPGQSNFYYGQVAAPLVLAFLAAVYWAPRQVPNSALALAFTTLKPTYGGPLLILMLCQRRWKTAVWGGALGGGLALIGFFLVFTFCDAARSPLEVVRGNQREIEADPGFDAQQTGFRLDAVAVIERIAGPQYTPIIKWLAPALILSVAGFAVALESSGRASERASWVTIPLVHLTALICIFHAVYDGLLLTWPLVLLGSELFQRGKPQRIARWVVFALLLVPTVNVASSRQFLAALNAQLGTALGTDEASPLWALANMSNGLCLLAAWLVLIAVAIMSAVADRRASNSAADRRLSPR